MASFARSSEVFLEINEAQLIATNEQLASLFLDVAAGCVTREQIESKLRSWIVTRRDKP
jgi:prophage maintenance system killer protein